MKKYDEKSSEEVKSNFEARSKRLLLKLCTAAGWPIPTPELLDSVFKETRYFSRDKWIAWCNWLYKPAPHTACRTESSMNVTRFPDVADVRRFDNEYKPMSYRQFKESLNERAMNGDQESIDMIFIHRFCGQWDNEVFQTGT